MRYFCLKPSFALSVALILAFQGSASAQGNWVEIDDQVLVAPLNMSADDLEDLNVLAPDGIPIGEVDEILGSDAATPTAIVVDFDDNSEFAAREGAIIPIDQFERAEGGLRLNADAAFIGAAEIYQD